MRRNIGSSSRRALAALLASVGLAIAVALSLTLATRATASAAAGPGPTSWLTYGFDDVRAGYNPHETTIGYKNAARLHKLWSRNLGGLMIAQPVEAAGVKVRGVAMDLIYEGTARGGFYAIRAANGHVVWHKNLGSMMTPCRDLPGRRFGVGGAGAISFASPGRGVVYVAGDDGAVHALDLATGHEEPGWPVRGVFDPSDLQVFGGLTLFKGRLYVTDANLCDRPPYHGGATEISVSLRKVVHHFYPAGPPRGGVSGGGIWGPGGVSVDPATGDVYAATGNALTTPQSYRYSEAVVRLSPTLGVLGSSSPALVGSDVDFGSTPVLFKPAGCGRTLLAAENKSGVLLTYATGDIRSGPLQRLQIADVHHGAFIGAPAWDPVTNELYIGNSSNSNSDVFKRGMVALKAGGDCRLSLAWQRVRGPTGYNVTVSPPTAANGVVYYGDGRGNTEYAFDAKTGKQLWQKSFAAGVYAAPTVVNGLLLVPAWDNKLYAFGLRRK